MDHTLNKANIINNTTRDCRTRNPMQACWNLCRCLTI